MFLNLSTTPPEFTCAGRVVNRSRHDLHLIAGGWYYVGQGTAVSGPCAMELKANGAAVNVGEQGAHRRLGESHPPHCEQPVVHWVQLADGTVHRSRPGLRLLSDGVRSHFAAPDSRFYRRERWLDPVLREWFGAKRERVFGTEPLAIKMEAEEQPASAPDP